MTQKRCGTCRWLRVPLNKGGRAVVRHDKAYYCTFEPVWPPLPDSITMQNRGFQTPSRIYMEGHYGTNCPTWEKKT